MENNNDEEIKDIPLVNKPKIRSEKIITRISIIITCILLFFVSIFLDFYFIYFSDIHLVPKILLCINHPLLFVIFLFIPSGIYIQFRYEENKIIYFKTCLIPYLYSRCTRTEIVMDEIKNFSLVKSKCLWCKNFKLYYNNKKGETIKIISGRDKLCSKK